MLSTEQKGGIPLEQVIKETDLDVKRIINLMDEIEEEEDDDDDDDL